MTELAIDGEVQLEFREHVAYIRLNRPESLNAFSSGLIHDLSAALDVIDAQDDCRVIVIAGNGRAFSAGGDLKEFRRRLESPDPGALVAFIREAARMLLQIEQNPRPVIAAVDGVAVAGGLELILCCDLVLATAGSAIGDAHLRYGVLPGGGGVARLIRKVPPNVAAHLLFTATTIPVEAASVHGLVNEVVPSDDLERRVCELATEISSRSPVAVRAVKQLMRDAAETTLPGGLALELETFAAHIRTRDFKEGIAAFHERREPSFEPFPSERGR